MVTQALAWEEQPPRECRGGAVAIGNFDGVHRGHAALMAELQRQARAVRGPAVALSFDPHPLQILRPKQFQPVLTTTAERARLLRQCGADHVLFLKTTPALLQLGAREFFRIVLQQRLAARALVEGENFAFGRNREGTVEMLRTFCRQAEVRLAIVPPVLHEQRPISSSRVRHALESGAVREAALLLNRPYSVRGTVSRGQQRGQTLGYPTANLTGIDTLVPGDGVYAVCVRREGQSWPGAANLGSNPTFGETVRKIEVHLIGFQGDLLGETLLVEFLDRLRATRPFAGAAELVEQLHQDVEQARQIVAQATNPVGAAAPRR